MKGTCVASAVPLNPGPISTKGTRVVRRSHRPWSEFGEGNPRSQRHSPQPRHKFGDGGTRFERRPLNHGTGACASRAPPLGHASRSNEDAATARRPPKRTCSPSPRSDQVVAVGLRCGKVYSKTLLPGHEVAVGLRCGKANTKTPRSLARLDPAFPRDSSGRYIIFSNQSGVVDISYLVPLLQEG